MDREKDPRQNGEDEAIEDCEAVTDEMTRQDHADRKEDAIGQTTFGDDRVTPRLNDGR